MSIVGLFQDVGLFQVNEDGAGIFVLVESFDNGFYEPAQRVKCEMMFF